MKQYPAEKIRNITLMGHAGSGKTSLVEAMIYNSGAINRMGLVPEGNTISDFSAEEKERGSSVNTSYAVCEWKNCKFNLIDTPGDFDYLGDQRLGLFAGDMALVVSSARDSGVAVGADKAMRMVARVGGPVAIFINRVDEANADFARVVKAFQAEYGKKIVPVAIPIVENEKMVGFIDVVEQKAYKLGDREDKTEIEIPAEFVDACQAYRTELMEQIAESSEELLDKFFSDIPFTDKEIQEGLTNSILDGSFVPVFGGSSVSDMGITFFMDTICRYFPGADKRPPAKAFKPDETMVELPCDAAGPLAAFVFKTVMDPFVGRISLLRIFSGTIEGTKNLYNSDTETEERVTGLYVMRGKEQIEVDKLQAGDIGALTKLSNTFTNQTLNYAENPLSIKKVVMPKPAMTMAISSAKQGEEDKVMQGMNRLQAEDTSFDIYNDAETGQMLIAGQGEMQLQTLCLKLKQKYGTEAELSVPRVPYRETIRAKVRVQGKHKKQSGGHGQYGDVWIRFEPGDQDDLVFEEEVVGGAVPKNYFPAVEKGLREAIKEGPLAGYPVVKLKAILDDGSYHDVDSNEMSFIQAARLAYRSGLPQANPIILEPINSVTVHIPEPFLGDIMGDMSKRRGRILGMGPSEEEPGFQTVEAEAPASELIKYSTDLRSMTQGHG